MPTRADIQAQVSGYLDRDDLDPAIPWWFITAHKEAQRLRNMKFMETTAREILQAGVDSYCAPSDLKEPLLLYSWDQTQDHVIKFYRQTDITNVRDRRRLVFPLTSAFFSDFVVNRAEFEQQLFAIWAGAIEIWPKPQAGDLAGKQLRLDYYRWADPPETNCSDFLTLNAFDYLLYRMLEEAVPYLDSTDSRLPIWQQKMQNAKAEILGVDVSAAHAGPLVIRG